MLVSVRYNGDVISIWNRDADNQVGGEDGMMVVGLDGLMTWKTRWGVSYALIGGNGVGTNCHVTWDPSDPPPRPSTHSSNPPPTANTKPPTPPHQPSGVSDAARAEAQGAVGPAALRADGLQAARPGAGGDGQPGQGALCGGAGRGAPAAGRGRGGRGGGGRGGGGSVPAGVAEVGRLFGDVWLMC